MKPRTVEIPTMGPMGDQIVMVEQFIVPSQSSSKEYVITHYNDDSWRCACVGWTRHVPRKDCKHILWVKTYGIMPIDPLLMATIKARKKAGAEITRAV